MIQGDKDNPIAITDTSDPEARDKRIAALIAKAMQAQINLFFLKNLEHNIFIMNIICYFEVYKIIYP
jgi:hypothetical protein